MKKKNGAAPSLLVHLLVHGSKSLGQVICSIHPLTQENRKRQPATKKNSEKFSSAGRLTNLPVNSSVGTERREKAPDVD
jgi:hypothetical protein